ncbi:MAG TPA: SDR family oxidoreductase, partial [Myxococcota bacterium]|nr:SDR family oxidoreductase [Myxococcota bacterium]
GARVLPIDAGAQELESLDAFAERAAREAGALALVQVFAPARGGAFLETSWRQVERACRAQLLAPFELARALALRMARAGGGDVVHVVPVAAVEAASGASESAVIGGGLAALTRALARELRAQRIRVNLVVARTEADDLGLELTPERAGWAAAPATVAADDVAEAVAYLLDTRSAALLGATLHVTGGEPTAR